MAATETVVFEIDVSSYTTALVEQTKLIKELGKEQKKLQVEAITGNEESAQALEQVNVQLKIAQQEYRTTQAALVGYTAAEKKAADTTDFFNNSVQTNRDLLKQYTAQLIQTVKPSQELVDRTKRLSDTLKQQESAWGDNRRNVGNYTASIIDAAKQLNVAGVNIGGIIDPLKNMGLGFKNAGGGVAGFQAALLGGIPLIIGAISAIGSQLQKFDAITEGLEDTFAGLNRSFDEFIRIGGQDFTGFGDLADNLERAYDEGVKLSAQLRELSEAQGAQRVNNVAAQKEVEALLLQSKDRTKTEAERIALLDEASKKEEANLKQNIKLAKERSDIAAAEFVRVLDAGFNDEKQRKEFYDAQVDLINLERESANLQEKIINRRNALEESAAAEREKRAAKEKAEAEKAAAERQKLLQDEFNKQKKLTDDAVKFAGIRDAANKKAEADRLAGLSKTFNEAIALNKAITDNDIAQADLQIGTAQEKERRKQEILVNSLERQLDLAIQFLGADGDITNIELEGIRTIQLALEKAKQAQDNGESPTLGTLLGVDKTQQQQIATGIQTAGQLVSGFADLVSTINEGRINEIEGVKNAEIEAINESGASEEEKEKKRVEAERKAAMATYELQKEQFETNKAISIIQTIINTAAAVVAQFANPTPYVGIALAALAAATGAAQIAVIAAQQPPAPPQFADGGEVIDIGGKPHSKGGTPIHVNGQLVAEAEAGEKMFIMKKNAAENIHMLSNWNQRFGGRSWDGAPVNYAALGGVIGDGGFTTRDITNQATETAALRAAITEGFKQAPAPVLALKEFNKKQAQMNRSVTISEL